MLLETLDQQIHETVLRALQEDLGDGDVTAALIPADTLSEATVISRQHAVLCGAPWFNALFHAVDPRVKVRWKVPDGARVVPDQTLCNLEGPARALLTGERTALNFLQTLSGTATCVRSYVDAVEGFPVRILDTRKTLPGLRQAQKYAVRAGGGHNHRMGLYDGILIKENHILAAGSITDAVQAARDLNTDLPVEVEVENLDEVREALDAGADILLLDNFPTETLTEAVKLTAGRAQLEASGGITLDTIRKVAATGVNSISVGALTKDLRAADLSMRFR
ncbi:MAG TPA: carboxylating nicotinate-nucleotide diphosphorylase [Gammaproteobacteria bacterium]|nr:carboxylating nicotinate-nucleotide diphosphorylase [Gammaproteobacteria bacterium]